MMFDAQKPENTPDIAVGELIALIVESGEDWKNVAIPAAAVTPSVTASPAAAADTSVTATPAS